MTDLRFDASKVLPVAEHALAASAHKESFGQDQGGPALWLVKDAGVYLMSNGAPGQLLPGGDESVVVVYADGLSDAANYDDISDAVGGDDFCEAIPIDAAFVAALRAAPAGHVLVVSLSADTIGVAIGG